jgi:hypothetical protein
LPCQPQLGGCWQSGLVESWTAAGFRHGLPLAPREPKSPHQQSAKARLGSRPCALSHGCSSVFLSSSDSAVPIPRVATRSSEVGVSFWAFLCVAGTCLVSHDSAVAVTSCQNAAAQPVPNGSVLFLLFWWWCGTVNSNLDWNSELCLGCSMAVRIWPRPCRVEILFGGA